mmetsp:Transcript_71460/g.119674  ORF Transcript_71460/g.119674 Transcript_71460/m.119674 type:complete len:92 (-) Transcript_71460:320-595(-)
MWHPQGWWQSDGMQCAAQLASLYLTDGLYIGLEIFLLHFTAHNCLLSPYSIFVSHFFLMPPQLYCVLTCAAGFSLELVSNTPSYFWSGISA